MRIANIVIAITMLLGLNLIAGCDEEFYQDGARDTEYSPQVNEYDGRRFTPYADYVSRPYAAQPIGPPPNAEPIAPLTPSQPYLLKPSSGHH